MTDPVLSAPPGLGPAASATAMPLAGRIDTPEQARAAAEEYESVFIGQMLQHMFAGIETDGPFGGGHAEKIYRSMMSQEYARSLAQDGGVGIADHVLSEILKAQEAGNQ